MAITTKFHGGKEKSQWRLWGWVVGLSLAIGHKLVRNYGGFISLQRDPESPRSMTQAYTLLAYLTMRFDNVRNRNFIKALRRKGKGKDALEVGPGALGVLTNIGLKAGLRHVIAVESNAAAFEVFKRKFRGKPVEPVLGFSTDVSLEAPVDLLFGEIFGSVVSSEGAVRAFSGTKHLLREGGEIIPAVAYTCIVPVRLPRMGWLRRLVHSHLLPFGALPTKAGFFRTYNFPMACWLSQPQTFEHYDFRDDVQPVQERNLVFKIKEGGKVDGFLLYIGFDLAGDGVDVFTSLEKTSWSNPLVVLDRGLTVASGSSVAVQIVTDVSGEDPRYGVQVSCDGINQEFNWSGC